MRDSELPDAGPWFADLTEDPVLDGELHRMSLELQRSVSPAKADALVREFVRRFADPAQCRAVGVPVHDAGFLIAETASVLAQRALYYLMVMGDPSPNAFRAWRWEQDRRRTAR